MNRWQRLRWRLRLAWLGMNAQIFEPSLILKPGKVRVNAYARIDSFVKIEGGQGVVIGNYTHVASFASINIGGGHCFLGDHVGIASGARIAGGTNLPTGISMSAASPAYMQDVARLFTRIEDYACVGMNAVVMPGVTIGRGAVIGASAVVTKDVPAEEIWAGVPAKRIGLRREKAG